MLLVATRWLLHVTRHSQNRPESMQEHVRTYLARDTCLLSCSAAMVYLQPE